MSLALLFMLGQSLAALPALSEGATVIVVSDDLRTVHARGTVEAGRLVFDTPLPAGLPVQLLFYPPSEVEGEAAPATMGAASTGLHSLRGSVDAGGQDLLVLEGPAAVSFRDWLRQQRSLELVLPRN